MSKKITIYSLLFVLFISSTVASPLPFLDSFRDELKEKVNQTLSKMEEGHDNVKTAVDVVKGGAEGVIAPVKDAAYMVEHPELAAKNTAYAVAHPKQSYQAMKEEQQSCYANKSRAECNSELGTGVIVGFALPELVPEATAVTVAEYTSRAGFIGESQKDLKCEKMATNGTCLVRTYEVRINKTHWMNITQSLNGTTLEDGKICLNCTGSLYPQMTNATTVTVLKE